MNLRPLPKHVQWLIVAIWVAVPFVTGELIDAAVDDRGQRLVVGIGSWAVWVTTLTAALVRRPITLTAVRLGTSAGAAAGVATTLMADSVSVITSVAGTVVPVVAWLLSMSAATGATFVDGASYGNERRFPLRVPVILLIGPVPLAWLVLIAGGSAGPLLLGSQRWAWGTLGIVVGWPAAVVAFRAMHGLSRRWLVFVPAGVVVHDFLTTREPFLMTRRNISFMGPAPADTSLDAEDLLDATQGAAGVVVMIELDNAVNIVPRPSKGAPSESRGASRIAIVPTEPGSVIVEAAARHIG